MKFSNHRHGRAIFLFFALACIGLGLYLLQPRKTYETFETSQVEIVIARYKETLDFLKDPIIRGKKITIYNKGNDTDFYLSKESEVNEAKETDKFQQVKIVNLPNVGREMHSYFTHILENYDTLMDAVVFLPGSADLKNKKARMREIFEKLPNLQKSYFNCSFSDKKGLAAFQIDTYKCTHPQNSQDCQTTIEKSEVRPFGIWFEKYLPEGNLQTMCMNYNSIFMVTREDIQKQPKMYYQTLMEQVDKSNNPEVVHFLERSWGQVFQLNDEKSNSFLEGKS